MGMRRLFTAVVLCCSLVTLYTVPALATSGTPTPNSSGPPTLVPIPGYASAHGLTSATAQNYPDCFNSGSSTNNLDSNRIGFLSTTGCSMAMYIIQARVCDQHQWGFWWWQWTGDQTCTSWNTNEWSDLEQAGETLYLGSGSGCYRAHGYHYITPPPGYYCNPQCNWDETANTVCH